VSGHAAWLAKRAGVRHVERRSVRRGPTGSAPKTQESRKQLHHRQRTEAHLNLGAVREA
jgi:hypothetical protein